jgi:flap endonuclease-1
MGVKLGDLVVKRELLEEELSNRWIAFDAHNILYQFIASIRTPEGYPLSTRDGHVISHLKGLFNRSAHFLRIGIKPVYIFDGEPHRMKKGTLELRRERKIKAQMEWEKALEEGDLARARTKAQQTSRLTDEMIEEACKILDLMGIPHMRALADGEAQASHMCLEDDVYAVASQDFDSLLFGSKFLIRNLGITGRRKLPGVKKWINIQTEIILLEETLNRLGISREQLVDMAILLGTDFNEGVKGIGPKRAYSIIREYGDLESAAKQKRIPLLEWEEIREIFLHPKIKKDYDLGMGEVDPDGIIAFLVGDLGFGREGVEKTLNSIKEARSSISQSSLDSFF